MPASTLVLCLAGPLQAWGADSRFNVRGTRPAPTKSGVIGMLAAASGRRRTDPIEDLAALRFGVRVDQQGRLLSDFHTTIDWRTGKSKPLTQRHYLCDARFVVGVEGPREMLEGLATALQSPVFPVYLGRRSCPPTGRMVLGIRESPLDEALNTEPWQAARWYRQRQAAEVHLPLTKDAEIGQLSDESIRDTPRSFAPRDRRHDLRPVVHGWVEMTNDHSRSATGSATSSAVVPHDPYALLGGQ